MNLPKPMTANNFDNIAVKLSTAVKDVAITTMPLNKFVEMFQTTPLDNAVPCAGTGQKREYSSLKTV